MTLAKALGGGLPIGVALMRQHVADAIAAGDHAATFGANPVACAAAVVVFNKLVEVLVGPLVEGSHVVRVVVL